MSILTDFRDHCRKMAKVEHKPECPSLGPKSRPIWAPLGNANGDIEALQWLGMTPAPPTCDGCVSDVDRAWFAHLANEVDAYLAAGGADEPLFGEGS